MWNSDLILTQIKLDFLIEIKTKHLICHFFDSELEKFYSFLQISSLKKYIFLNAVAF